MKTTDPLVQIILAKRAREKIVASQRIGKLSKKKCQKTTFRDLKNKKDWVVSERVVRDDNSFANYKLYN